MAKTFFGPLEQEFIMRSRRVRQAEARHSIFRYIEAWYNPVRGIFRSAVSTQSGTNCSCET